jgi:hypothetical protein
MTNEVKDKVLTAKTSKSIIDKLDARAKRDNRTRSNMVDTILREYLGD